MDPLRSIVGESAVKFKQAPRSSSRFDSRRPDLTRLAGQRRVAGRTPRLFHAVWLVALLAASGGAGFPSGPTGPERPTDRRPADAPNILLLMVDDLNDWIEPLQGHPQAQTPSLVRLASCATLFRNAHCQAPICNPSRVSMLTGRLPSSTGVYYLSPLLRDCETTRPLETIPQYFARHGYTTRAAGKILHGKDETEFQLYAGRFGDVGPRPKQPLAAGHTHPLWDWGIYPRPGDVPPDFQMPDEKLADWLVGQLEQAGDEPFFLAGGFQRPHVPLYVPPPWFESFPLATLQLPVAPAEDLADIPVYAQDLSWSAMAPRHQWMVDQDQWPAAVQAYLASVKFVDAQIGKVLDALAASPHASNTIVVLCSDHGFHLGTKERWGKRSLWEDSTRVPLLIATPGQKNPEVCDQPAGLIDLYPTLCELAGLPIPEGLEGHSLVPQLQEPGSERSWPAVTTFGQNNHSLRGRDWRYTVYADGSEEFYDHRRDPREWHNLLADPQQRAAWQPRIDEIRQSLPEVNRPMAAGSRHADARPGSAPDIDSARPGNRN